MTDIKNDAAFADLDTLLDSADMDDIADLPPMGVPPTGHYNCLVTAERKPVNEKDAVVVTWEITGINEVAETTESNEVKVGQKFTENFIPKKDDGEVNDFALGAMKERFAPFAAHFGITGKGFLGQTIQQTKEVAVAVAIRRVPNKKNPEYPRLKIVDLEIL